jgi:hypothetical protein
MKSLRHLLFRHRRGRGTMKRLFSKSDNGDASEASIGRHGTTIRVEGTSLKNVMNLPGKLALTRNQI